MSSLSLGHDESTIGQGQPSERKSSRTFGCEVGHVEAEQGCLYDAESGRHHVGQR